MSRLLPAILLLGGAGVAVRGGGEVTGKAIDTVKTVLTRYELAEAARHLTLDETLGNRPPRTSAELAAWLDANHHARFSRDPTADLWQQPYLLQRLRGGGRLLISLGPNGRRDHCAEQPAGAAKADDGSRDDDDICAASAPPDSSGGGSGGGDGGRGRRYEDVAPDDRYDANGRRRRRGRDSPFRQIRRERD